MSSTFKLKKTILEKALQNLNFNELANIIDNTNRNFAIDLLSVDKNMDLLTKKSDFEFLNKIFYKLSTLKPNSEIMQFLKISNEHFEQKLHNIKLTTEDSLEKFEQFIVRTMDLSISKKKKHSSKELQQVISIGKNFSIEEWKLVNWIAKVTANSNNTELLEQNFKLPLLHKKDLRERYVSLMINVSQSTQFLDKVFNLYESTIYETYAKHKSNHSTWNCLLPKQTWNNYKYLPYIDENKIQWLEDKKIGYKNNPFYFELYQLEIEFRRSKDTFESHLKEDYFKDIIYNSLIDYHNFYYPEKEKYFKQYIEQEKNNDNPERFIYSEEYKTFKNWVNENPVAAVLSVYDTNKDFYAYSKKLKLKVKLEDKLPEKITERRLKI